MPLLRSLGKDPRTLAAIDMALLRSFSSRFKVPMDVRSGRRLCMKGIEDEDDDEDEDDAAAGLRHSRAPWKGRFTATIQVSRTLKLSMNRWLVGARGWCVNRRLVDSTFPLTPALSLGERET